jgi:phosphoribosylformimino-5-aminoimidazole carboxamide ribotide isomerase
MNLFEVIPAIDIIDGECVRLSMGDYGVVTKYSSNPVEVAQSFESFGFRKLHLVDLDGAKGDSSVNLKVLEKIAASTSMEIQFGGGIKSEESALRAFESGAGSVICGSLAVKDRDLFLSLLTNQGPDRVVLGVDVKEELVYINGWKEKTNNTIYDFISSFTEFGLKKVICTDIAKDGMLSGPSLDLYKSLTERFAELIVIASGGVSDIKDIKALSRSGAAGVVVGKAFYEKRIDIENLVEWLQRG